MTGAGWAIAIGLTIFIEAFLVWRLSRVLDRGTIKIDPLFWLADVFGFDFTVYRATNPVMYWGGVLAMMFFGIMVLVIFATIVVGNRH
jgi:hypothetical protein